MHKEPQLVIGPATLLFFFSFGGVPLSIHAGVILGK